MPHQKWWLILWSILINFTCCCSPSYSLLRLPLGKESLTVPFIIRFAFFSSSCSFNMSPLLPRAGKIALLSVFFLPKVWSDQCDTFGVDFQNEGSYFQNSLSTDNFTFVSRFEGCQNTFAKNSLVDPSGYSIPCSNTDTQPDDTPELSTW